MLQPGFTAEIGGSSKRKETEIDRQQQKTAYGKRLQVYFLY